MSAHLPADFRRRFLGTHFFNPPRYLKLLETIPGPETDPAVLAAMEAFADRVMGKGVVRARTRRTSSATASAPSASASCCAR